MKKIFILPLLLISTLCFAKSPFPQIKTIADLAPKVSGDSWVFVNLDKFVVGTKGVYTLNDKNSLHKFFKDLSSKTKVYGVTSRGGKHHKEYIKFLINNKIDLTETPSKKKDGKFKSDYYSFEDGVVYLQTIPQYPSGLGHALSEIFNNAKTPPQKFIFVGHDFEDAHAASTVASKKLKFKTDAYLIDSGQETKVIPINRYAALYPYVQPGDWVFSDLDETLLVFDEDTETTSAVDPFSKTIVRMLQDKVPVFALTARTSKKQTKVLNRIKKIGISFRTAQKKLALPNADGDHFRYPEQSFKDGVIFASKPSNLLSVKGPTLRHFLEKITLKKELMPKRIIFVDNRLEDIESVQDTDFGVPKLLFHFQFKGIEEPQSLKRHAVDVLTDPALPQEIKRRKVTPTPKWSDDDDGTVYLQESDDLTRSTNE